MMCKNSVDLHTHSSYSSDGEIPPRRLVEAAVDIGLRAIALTDHDTVAGVEEFLHAGTELGIETIAGIEITTTYDGKFTHILGYFVDHNSSELTAYIRKLEEARIEQTAGRIAKLRSLGIEIDEERVAYFAQGRLPVGPIIGMAALEDVRNRHHPLLKPLFEEPMAERPFFFFDRELLANGKPADFQVERPSIFDAVDVIKQAGGVAVFAHPGDGYTLPDDKPLFEELAKYGLAGIEVFCSYHNEADELSFGSLADELGLIKTAGSDYHGPKIKPKVHLGDISYSDYSIVSQLKLLL